MGAISVIALFFGTYVSLALLPRGRAGGYGLAAAAAIMGIASRFAVFAPFVLPVGAAIAAAALALGLRHVMGDKLADRTYFALLGVPPMVVILILMLMAGE